MKSQGFYKGSAILIGMVIVTKIMGLVFKLLLTNLLGGTGMAYYQSVYAVFTPVFAVAVGGIPTALAIMTAENFALERYKNVRKIRRTAFIVFSLAGVLLTVLFVLLSGTLSQLVFLSDSLRFGLIAVAPTMLLCCLISCFRGYFEGMSDMIPTAVSEIIETVFKLILGISFAYFTYHKLNGRAEHTVVLSLTAAAAVLGVSLSSFFACVYLLLRLKLRGDGITHKMIEADSCTDSFKSITRQLIHFSSPIALTAAISTLINMVDLMTIPAILRRLIAKGLFDTSALIAAGISEGNIPEFIYGSFTALALTVTGMIPGLTAMPCKPALPKVSKARATGDRASLKASINEIMLFSSLIAFPAAAGLSVFSKEVLLFLFPSRISEVEVSVEPMLILSGGLVFGCLLPPVFALLQAVGRPESTVRIMAVSCVIKLILNITLMNIPGVNINGAAAALVISDMAALMLGLWKLRQATDIKADVKKWFISPMFAAILCAAGARVMYDAASFMLMPRVRLVISVGFGGIIYIFALYLLNILPKNLLRRKKIKKIAKRA